MDGLDFYSGYLRRKVRVKQMMETQGQSKSILSSRSRLVLNIPISRNYFAAQVSLFALQPPLYRASPAQAPGYCPPRSPGEQACHKGKNMNRIMRKGKDKVKQQKGLVKSQWQRYGHKSRFFYSVPTSEQVIVYHKLHLKSLTGISSLAN